MLCGTDLKNSPWYTWLTQGDVGLSKNKGNGIKTMAVKSGQLGDNADNFMPL